MQAAAVPADLDEPSMRVPEQPSGIAGTAGPRPRRWPRRALAEPARRTGVFRSRSFERPPWLYEIDPEQSFDRSSSRHRALRNQLAQLRNWQVDARRPRAQPSCISLSATSTARQNLHALPPSGQGPRRPARRQASRVGQSRSRLPRSRPSCSRPPPFSGSARGSRWHSTQFAKSRMPSSRCSARTFASECSWHP